MIRLLPCQHTLDQITRQHGYTRVTVGQSRSDRPCTVRRHLCHGTVLWRCRATCKVLQATGKVLQALAYTLELWVENIAAQQKHSATPTPHGRSAGALGLRGSYDAAGPSAAVAHDAAAARAAHTGLCCFQAAR